MRLRATPWLANPGAREALDRVRDKFQAGIVSSLCWREQGALKVLRRLLGSYKALKVLIGPLRSL